MTIAPQKYATSKNFLVGEAMCVFFKNSDAYSTNMAARYDTPIKVLTGHLFPLKDLQSKKKYLCWYLFKTHDSKIKKFICWID